MKQSAFCEYCMSEIGYKVRKVNKTTILKSKEISYAAKEAICNKCGNEIFISDICDYNLNTLYGEYKKDNNIISVIELRHIIMKYSINQETLSRLLGWERETVRRYLDGDMITSSHSDILKNIYENPDYYSVILQTNKERISAVDYNKSRQTVKDILNKNVTEEKIDAVIKFLLVTCEDFTELALQNLLYYVQAFCYILTDKFIFEENCEADINGSFYRSVKERYEKFGYKEINEQILINSQLSLEESEKDVIENVAKFYGCYSGKILKQMVQYEAPWILSKNNKTCENNFEYENNNTVIRKNMIVDYFRGVKEKYSIINSKDIQNYSVDLFNKISM